MESTISNDYEPIQKPIPDSGIQFPPTKFPLRWDAEYYAVWPFNEWKHVECPACGGKGRVVLGDGNEYDCPNCDCDGAVNTMVENGYIVLICRLNQISVYGGGKEAMARFTCEGHADLVVKDDGLKCMAVDKPGYGQPHHIHNDYEEAAAEAALLNKGSAEKGKTK